MEILEKTRLFRMHGNPVENSANSLNNCKVKLTTVILLSNVDHIRGKRLF